VRRELRNRAILLRFTLSLAMPRIIGVRPPQRKRPAKAARPATTGKIRIEPCALPVSIQSYGQSREPVMDQHVIENPEAARQGAITGRVRYILAISTALVVILFAVAYAVSV
jgi:hypothetical protein